MFYVVFQCCDICLDIGQSSATIAIVVCIRLVSCCCLPKDRAGISCCYESESINVNNWSCGLCIHHTSYVMLLNTNHTTSLKSFLCDTLTVLLLAIDSELLQVLTNLL